MKNAAFISSFPYSHPKSRRYIRLHYHNTRKKKKERRTAMTMENHQDQTDTPYNRNYAIKWQAAANFCGCKPAHRLDYLFFRHTPVAYTRGSPLKSPFRRKRPAPTNDLFKISTPDLATDHDELCLFFQPWMKFQQPGRHTLVANLRPPRAAVLGFHERQTNI